MNIIKYLKTENFIKENKKQNYKNNIKKLYRLNDFEDFVLNYESDEKFIAFDRKLRQSGTTFSLMILMLKNILLDTNNKKYCIFDNNNILVKILKIKIIDFINAYDKKLIVKKDKDKICLKGNKIIQFKSINSEIRGLKFDKVFIDNYDLSSNAIRNIDSNQYFIFQQGINQWIQTI